MGIKGTASIGIYADNNKLFLLSKDSMFGESRIPLGVSLEDVMEGIKLQTNREVFTLLTGEDGSWKIEEKVFKASVGTHSVEADLAFFNSLSRTLIVSLRTIALYGSPAARVEFRPGGEVSVFPDNVSHGGYWGFQVRYSKLIEVIKTGIPYHGDGWTASLVDKNVEARVISVKRTGRGMICLSAAEVLSGLSMSEESDKV